MGMLERSGNWIVIFQAERKHQPKWRGPRIETCVLAVLVQTSLLDICKNVK